MDFDEAIGYLKKVKTLGFREEEIDIPLPKEKEYPAEVPLEENFAELLNIDAESFYASLLFSDFPYSPKGCFAFSLVSSELAKNTEVKYEKNGNIKVMRFGRIANADINWAKEIERLKDPNSNIAEIFALFPCKSHSDRALDGKFIVYGDGKNVHCYEKSNDRIGRRYVPIANLEKNLIQTQWKKIFTIPFIENLWPVPTAEFICVYSSGKDIYGTDEFNPAIGNLVFAATPYEEYGWITEQVNLETLAEAVEQFAEIYSKIYGQHGASCLKNFLLLSASLKNAVFSEMKMKRIYKPEFFVNIPYMLAKTEYEKSKGNFSEALFSLRKITDLLLLALRAAPLGGSMLELSKFFNSRENIAPKRFLLEKNVVQVLHDCGVNFNEKENKLKKENKGIGLRKGKDFYIQNTNENISMTFGTLVMVLHSLDFFSGRKKTDKNADFWKSLKSFDAFLCIALYPQESEPVLSLLEEECEIKRGSDIFKVEKIGAKILVKRAMVYENGKAKEIKLHLAKIIEIADKRSVNESANSREIGSCGEVLYKIVAGEKKKGAMLALVNSKRFY